MSHRWRRWAFSHLGRAIVCNQCDKIDAKILHYRLMQTRLTDQKVLDGLKQLLEDLQLQKTALHPA